MSSTLQPLAALRLIDFICRVAFTLNRFKKPRSLIIIKCCWILCCYIACNCLSIEKPSSFIFMHVDCLIYFKGFIFMHVNCFIIIWSGDFVFMHVDCLICFRGFNGPGGWVFKPIQGEPNKCIFMWVMNTDIKVCFLSPVFFFLFFFFFFLAVFFFCISLIPFRKLALLYLDCKNNRVESHASQSYCCMQSVQTFRQSCSEREMNQTAASLVLIFWQT